MSASSADDMIAWFGADVLRLHFRQGRGHVIAVDRALSASPKIRRQSDANIRVHGQKLDRAAPVSAQVRGQDLPVVSGKIE